MGWKVRLRATSPYVLDQVTGAAFAGVFVQIGGDDPNNVFESSSAERDGTDRVDSIGGNSRYILMIHAKEATQTSAGRDAK